MERAVQSCWYCRLCWIVIARWRRWAGWTGSEEEFAVEFMRCWRADGEGGTSAMAEGAAISERDAV